MVLIAMVMTTLARRSLGESSVVSSVCFVDESADGQSAE